VEPIAEQVRANRRDIVRTAQQVPDADWDRQSPAESWSYRDLLAHLAGDTEKNLLAALRSIVAGEPVSPALFENIDEKNARDLEVRHDRSIQELVAEIEADGVAILDLLTKLREEDAERRQAEFPLALGEALLQFPTHDATHLADLRTALEGTQ
jgi:uncharacterized protein (TIGR03083 family)